MRFFLAFGYLLTTGLVNGQELDPPSNFQAQWILESGSIQLSWDSIKTDNAGYHLFVQQPGQQKMYLWGKAGPIASCEYDFHIGLRQGGKYSFQVAAFNNFPEVEYGLRSELIDVEVPSTYLPIVKEVNVKTKKKSLEISWSYDNEIFDLKDFLITINGLEYISNSSIRSIVLEDQDAGTYSIFITARSRSGVLSAASSTKLVILR